LDKVIELDSTSSLSYYNRAIVRSQIGDYSRALEDYDRVARYSPDNVLVYYNRGTLYAYLGEPDRAIEDFSRAIELYPDFANAYLNRSAMHYERGDMKSAKRDHEAAQRKIAAYKARLSDSTYSIYADTTQHFDRLLSFDTNLSGSRFERIRSAQAEHNLTLIQLFKFTLTNPDSTLVALRKVHYTPRELEFRKRIGNPQLTLTHGESNIPADSLLLLDRAVEERIKQMEKPGWMDLFERGVTQSLVKQYTNSVNTYTRAIELNPTNPFLYLNRSTTRAEMIDFISSIDNSYQRITIDSDPANRLHNNSKRTYSYDEARADLNKVLKLYPDFAHAYYNRANLSALSGDLPAAYEDYTRAIELNPHFAEAYYNRGIVQIFMKDTRKGCLDISKAGELGIVEAYEVLKRYANHND
jgi:tetratricopeptide (TPR) repeat protein